MMKTKSFKSEDSEKNWHLVDAKNKVLGRLAVKIANILSGKNNSRYSPNADLGDFVVVVNAEKVKVTGNKGTDKIYHSHTGYPGGIKSISFDKLLEKAPERTIQSAVKGMLPKNPLGRQMFRKLKVYSGSEHPHVAQQPKTIEI